MWVASLKAFVDMAKIMQEKEDIEKFSKILEQASFNFDKKLWNGEIFILCIICFPESRRYLVPCLLQV